MVCLTMVPVAATVCIALNDSMIINDELEGMWKDIVTV
jgi:hypothetical protein